MTKLVFAAVALIITANALALAESVRLITTLPADLITVATYYRQPVYDSADEKIGQVGDLLLDKDGQILVAMISVGDFLGLTRKDVAVPFSALQLLERERKPYLILETDRRRLREAPAFKYNSVAKRWERQED